MCSACLSPGVPCGAPEQEAWHEELKKHPKHRLRRSVGLGTGVVPWPPAQSAALAHILETVFSRRFSVLLKLRWAVLAITKAHRFLS